MFQSGVIQDVGVKATQQEGAKPGLGLPGPEMSYFGFSKDIVPAEDLVRSFTSEHDFVSILMDYV